MTLSDPTDILKTVIIIGGGFSGLSVAVNLVEKTTVPLKIVLLEKAPVVGTGVAFGTEESIHPLNVMAANMGLSSGKPEGFYEWLNNHEALWRTADASFADLRITPTQYLPRKLYGIYLKDVLSKTRVDAYQKGVELSMIQAEAVDISFRSHLDINFQVKTASGQEICGDYVVLATNVPTNKRFAFETSQLLASPGYIRNIWETPLSIEKSATVAIMGSGLTAIDALWSLQAKGFEGNIWVVSRSGKFPHHHIDTDKVIMERFHVERFPRTCLALFKFWLAEWNKWHLSGRDWRGLIDAFKPLNTQFWKHLDLSSKKQFLRRLFPLWNRHRHRMTAESGQLLKKLFSEGRLELLSGRIAHVELALDNKLCLQLVSKDIGKSKKLLIDYVINCTGPEYVFIKRQEPLMYSLIKKKLVVLDDLGFGLKTQQGERLAGDNGGRLYALGSLLFGERLETTSVPDIREQASSIAQAII